MDSAMKRVALNHIRGGGTPRLTSIFVGPREPTIPAGIACLLRGVGIGAEYMLATGQKFTVAQVDQHLAGQNLKPDVRASIKASLAQVGLL